MHYYDRTGAPRHTVIGKNGKERDTIITDARKLGLVPSVSTVKDLGVGFGLIEWMHNLLLDCAADNPYHPHEYSTLDEWKKIVFSKYRTEKEKAPKRGTEIHNKLEDYYKTGNICPIDEPYIVPTIELIEKTWPGVKFHAETTFADFEKGFGGCVDLHSEEGIIIDFKTKDKTELTKSMQYDDHRIQLVAYEIGLKLPKESTRWNAFISTHKDTKGKVLLVENKEFDKYEKMLYALINLWQVKNNYIPGAK